MLEARLAAAVALLHVFGGRGRAGGRGLTLGGCFARRCLLLNGGDDPLVPAISNENLVAALHAAGRYTGSAADSLEMIVYPGVAHATPRPMIDDTIAWFVKKLPAPSGESKL